jgi:hypothetical protein
MNGSRPDPSIDQAAKNDQAEQGRVREIVHGKPDQKAPAGIFLPDGPNEVAKDRHPYQEFNQDAARSALHRRVDSDFVYHAPSQAMIPQFAQLRELARYMAHEMIDTVPPGRELSLGLTSLEETVMWANAGIARQAPPDQPAGQQERKDPRQNVPPFAR